MDSQYSFSRGGVNKFAHKPIPSNKLGRMTTLDDLLKGLNELKVQADKNTDKLRNDMASRMDILDEKLEDVKTEAAKKEENDNRKMKTLETRLEKIEKNLSETKDKCDERRKLAGEQKQRTNEFKEAVGLDREEEQEIEEKPQKWSELVSRSQEEERKRREERTEKEKEKMQKHWRKEIFVKERGEKSKLDDDWAQKKKILEKKEVLEEKKLNLRIGDSPSKHDEREWSWEESDGEWQGTQDKKENVRLRKIERYRRRKILKEKTSHKARHMLGLGPIRQRSVDYFVDITADVELAKEMAIKEFMATYLQYTETELLEHDIVDSQISARAEDIVYVTFADYGSIREIHARAAEIRNDDIIIRNYVPPQFWERYSHISKHCTEIREKNRDIKTLMRFGETDIEVLTKDKTKDEGYKTLSLEEIEKSGAIPKFDHTIKWRRRTDRMSRRKTTQSSEKLCPPSLRQSEAFRRKHSENDNVQSKRQRNERAADVSQPMTESD